MGKEEVVKYLEGKVKNLEVHLKELNQQISKLTKERDLIVQAYTSYRYTLDSENRDSRKNLYASSEIKMPLHNFSDLPIHRAAEVVLKDAARGMTTRELTEEIIKRGKKMTGPNSVTIVNNGLRRFPDLFKKDGNLWTLIIEEGTRAA